jgi:aspartyl-tRNA(Asn)/glutamyl-tRNA(Gln) amidotransferase subunit A
MTHSRDRLEAILSRLSARAGDERVFMKLYLEDARAAADAADGRRKAGEALGPLDGVIVSIKDLFDIAGEPTLAGSLMRKSAAAATKDAPVVARLKAAGAIILGKTAMTEFAFTALGVNPHYGTPGNAADSSRIPGGSSSGAGVSAAEGTSVISIGSDTGGSVRIPAALNGVAGFKPTARRVPLAGAFPLSPTLDSIGPLARSVADCALADAVMAGERPGALEAAPLGGLRLGVPRGRLLEHMDAEVAGAFEHSLSRLAGSGAGVADFGIDDLLQAMRSATSRASVAAMEGAEIHADWLSVGAPTPVDPRVSGPLSRALAIPATVYIRTMRHRTELLAAMDERLAGIDALVLPTVPVVASPIAPLLDDERLSNRIEDLLLRNTQIANQFDLCAISLPMPGSSLPTGLMLVARNGHDRRLLEMAAAVEALLAR